MAWIELHQSLPTHKKTRRLARALGLGVTSGIPQTVGHLCVFWLWSLDNITDGDLSGLEAQDIADAAGWTGEANVFLNGMIDAGFIDRTDGGIAIHDWDEYVGKTIARRTANRERQRRYRETGKIADRRPPTDEIESTFDPEWEKTAKFYEQNLGLLPVGKALEKLISYFDDFGCEMVCKAIELTNLAQAQVPFKYLSAILDKWGQTGIDTPEKADAYGIDLKRRLEQSRNRDKPTEAAKAPSAIQGKFY